jgi:hypothetical protein
VKILKQKGSKNERFTRRNHYRNDGGYGCINR